MLVLEAFTLAGQTDTYTEKQLKWKGGTRGRDPGNKTVRVAGQGRDGATRKLEENQDRGLTIRVKETSRIPTRAAHRVCIGDPADRRLGAIYLNT